MKSNMSRKVDGLVVKDGQGQGSLMGFKCDHCYCSGSSGRLTFEGLYGKCNLRQRSDCAAAKEIVEISERLEAFASLAGLRSSVSLLLTRDDGLNMSMDIRTVGKGKRGI